MFYVWVTIGVVAGLVIDFFIIGSFCSLYRKGQIDQDLEKYYPKKENKNE